MFWKVLLLTVLAADACAQTATPAQGAQVTGSASGNAAITISLPDAIRLAQVNASQFRTAVTDAGVAHEDKVQARAALLPSISYSTGAIFTQPNGADTGVFVANNGANEYLSQGNAHEALSLALVSDFRRARALEAVARRRKKSRCAGW